MALKFFNSVTSLKTKSQKVLGANSYVGRSYRGKSGKGGGAFLNRVMNTFPICPALQFMIVNEVKRFVLYCLSTILGYVQGDLRKRQLMGSFAEQFNVKSFFQAFFVVILSGLVVAKLSFFQAYY